MARNPDDFLDILDGFFEKLHESGAVLFSGCQDMVTATAKSIMNQPDMRYVPGHKVTELMANLVNLAASIAAEGWLSESQAREQFKALTLPDSILIKHFMSEANMEKARYEPVMLAEHYDSPRAERNALLRIRLKRMLRARQSYDPLPNSFIRAVRIAGHRVLQADCFGTYRAGALLQMFDDMIRQADHIATTTYDEFAGIASLNFVLREEGNLWKLYRHKAPRFKAKPGDPLHAGVFPSSRATMLYVPDHPSRPTLH